MASAASSACGKRGEEAEGAESKGPMSMTAREEARLGSGGEEVDRRLPHLSSTPLPFLADVSSLRSVEQAGSLMASARSSFSC